MSFEESKPAALWKERNSIKPRDTIVIPTVNKTDPTANAATLLTGNGQTPYKQNH